MAKHRIGRRAEALAQIERQAPGQRRAASGSAHGRAGRCRALAAPAGAGAATDANAETTATFTPIGLFLRADVVVRCVLGLLVLASFWTWVLIIDKSFSFLILKRKARNFEKTFWSGRSLDELYSQHSTRPDQPFTAVFVAALREWKRSFENGGPRDGQLSPA